MPSGLGVWLQEARAWQGPWGKRQAVARAPAPAPQGPRAPAGSPATGSVHCSTPADPAARALLAPVRGTSVPIHWLPRHPRLPAFPVQPRGGTELEGRALRTPAQASQLVTKAGPAGTLSSKSDGRGQEQDRSSWDDPVPFLMLENRKPASSVLKGRRSKTPAQDASCCREVAGTERHSRASDRPGAAISSPAEAALATPSSLLMESQTRQGK